jgi:hypothetical protein
MGHIIAERSGQKYIPSKYDRTAQLLLMQADEGISISA